MDLTLSNQIIDRYVASLPGEAQRTAFLITVNHLRDLSENAQVLSEFLSSFATSVADLYAATSVAIWFEDSAQNVQRKVDVGWRNLSLDEPTAAAHRELVSYAIHAGKAIAVQPFSAPSARSSVSNPTDSFLLLAPTKFDHKDVAVLEIALGPKPLRKQHRVLMDSYFDWLRWLDQLLQQGMQRCFAAAEQPFLLAISSLQQTELVVEEIQSQIRMRIEASLQSFSGQNFGSLSANQTVAKQVHGLLDSKGLRVKCPECGAAAILRCQNAGNSKTGAFMFDHYLDSGRTFHGGQTVFPNLEIVSKPPRRKAN